MRGSCSLQRILWLGLCGVMCSVRAQILYEEQQIDELRAKDVLIGQLLWVT